VDPDSNLAEQLTIAARINAIQDGAHRHSDEAILTESQRDEIERLAYQLAELVESLDEWIRKGGGLPRVWPWIMPAR
jgi:hypothetical protein